MTAFCKYSKFPIIGLMKGRSNTNNKKTQIIQNILFGAFTGIHTLLTFVYTTDVYLEKQFVMITCICDLFRLLLTPV
jgi:hypothetical protein